MDENDRDALRRVFNTWHNSVVVSEHSIAANISLLLDAAPENREQILKLFRGADMTLLEKQAGKGGPHAPAFRCAAKMIEGFLRQQGKSK